MEPAKELFQIRDKNILFLDISPKYKAQAACDDNDTFRDAINVVFQITKHMIRMTRYE